MTPAVGFIVFLIVTLGLLGGVALTGFQARRKTHYALVAGAVAALAVTVYWAEKLGELYDLEASGWIYPVHLWCAKITVVAYLAPIATGILTIRNIERRRVHKVVAFTVLGLTVLTAVTGSWMLSLSEPLAEDS